MDNKQYKFKGVIERCIYNTPDYKNSDINTRLKMRIDENKAKKLKSVGVEVDEAVESLSKIICVNKEKRKEKNKKSIAFTMDLAGVEGLDSRRDTAKPSF